VAIATAAHQPSLPAELVLTGSSVDYSHGKGRRLAPMSAGVIWVSPKWLLRRSNNNFLDLTRLLKRRYATEQASRTCLDHVAAHATLAIVVVLILSALRGR
jgi:hypothetical protein